MTFEEILDQAVAMLQRRGRMTYRTLKLQFKLDDETLEALKEEILYSQPQVVDDEGKGLIWTGESETKPAPTSTHPAQSEETQQDHPTQVKPPQESCSPDAERRQLTVMFCDLVDSTRLSAQLDPEDYRDVVREYQQVCTEVIQRYDGHIAQYLGDGLLIYFGYPVAHEEDAQRAVHTGLGIVEAIGNLNTRLEPDKGIRLAIRLGIHTGLVVVGEMGGIGRQEQLALGETPNMAARIQGLAEPNTVIISDATYRLVQGYFTCQAMGEQTLRGVSQPTMIYQVLRESGVQSRLEVASTRGLTPLIGRESEVTLLLERWEQTKDGQGQIILLSGEAGIGKSRLVQVLKDHVASEPHTRWECRSSPYHQNTALYPLIDLLQRALQWHQDDSPEQRLEKLEHLLSQYRLPLEETVPLFAPLLSLSVSEDRYSPLNLSPQRQRQKTLESIVAMLLELAEQQPVLFILEDLHWTDPTTLEFLSLLVEQVPAAALYTLLTCRPHFQPSWTHRSYLTEITVNRLSRGQIERMAERVAGGKKLPEQVLQQIVEKTDGVPLFVEEMTKTVLESGVLKETNEHYELAGSFTTLVIPSTLQDSLMARLDRLATAKGIAQISATIGRQFSYSLLQALVHINEQRLQRELGRLVEAELLYQRGLPPQATYTFKHALIQNAAYESLLRSTRQGYHQRIAEVLEELFPDTANHQPELLGYHYTEAGLHEQAVNYWYQAGQNAMQRSANVEAIDHLKKGLAGLKRLPETPERRQQALTLHIPLGVALTATRGMADAEVEHVFSQARDLCQQVGETPQLAPTLFGLRAFYIMRGDLQTSRDLDEQLLRLAQQMQDTPLLIEAHWALGTTLCFLGEIVPARAHLEQSITLYDAQPPRAQPLLDVVRDPGVAARSWISWLLWVHGYPDQARTRSQQAFTLAQALAHPYSQAIALASAAVCSLLCREHWSAQERAEAAVAITQEWGFPMWLAASTVCRGWAQAVQGEGAAGIAQMRQGLVNWQTLGVALLEPYWLTLLAAAYGQVGQPEEGLCVLSEALSILNSNGEHFWEAELHRLKGTLLLAQSSDNHTEAESCFHQAMTIAQNHSAKSWELRAATSLAKLWQRQGKRQEAYDLLAPVYGWFTEGFDTVDLQDAKALLSELEA
jgi:class 3 adenylate cyclase/predicted ATPase